MAKCGKCEEPIQNNRYFVTKENVVLCPKCFAKIPKPTKRKYTKRKKQNK